MIVLTQRMNFAIVTKYSVSFTINFNHFQVLKSWFKKITMQRHILPKTSPCLKVQNKCVLHNARIRDSKSGKINMSIHNIQYVYTRNNHALIYA